MHCTIPELLQESVICGAVPFPAAVVIGIETPATLACRYPKVIPVVDGVKLNVISLKAPGAIVAPNVLPVSVKFGVRYAEPASAPTYTASTTTDAGPEFTTLNTVQETEPTGVSGNPYAAGKDVRALTVVPPPDG